MTPSSWRRFITDNTRLLAPPLVPEIELHLAEESLPIWQKTEEELGQMNVPPPYWAFAWAGGQALARFVLDNAQLIRGKSVLDLGSGSGLSAIAAAKAGAAKVLATDIDPVSIAALAMNAETNGVVLDTTTDDLLAAPAPAHDVVLVGDLFYERELADRVQFYIDSAVKRSAIVLIGDPRRSYFPHDRYTKVAEYRVPVTRELEDAEIKQTAVWSARPLPAETLVARVVPSC